MKYYLIDSKDDILRNINHERSTTQNSQPIKETKKNLPTRSITTKKKARSGNNKHLLPTSNSKDSL